MSAHRLKILTFLVILCLAVGCTPPAGPTAVPTSAPLAVPSATPEPIPAETDDTWLRVYGGTRDTFAAGVLSAEDGGFYILGTANIAWNPTMRGDIYLLRTDAAGEVLWEKTYGGGRYNSGLALLRADDGNLLVAGVTDLSGNMDAYLVKIDPDGNPLWEKTYGGQLDEYPNAILATADGGYLLAGNIVDPEDVIADPGAAGYDGYAGRSNLHLLKLDADGNELWSRTLVNAENVIGVGAVSTPDGGFLLLASVLAFPDLDNDLLLVKLDDAGNELWSRTWEEENIVARDLVATADGNLLILSLWQPAGGTAQDQETLLLVVDPDGNEIGRSIHGEEGMVDDSAAAGRTVDGGAIVVGERQTDLSNWFTEYFLLRTDAQGEKVWERTESIRHTMYASVEQLPEGGFLVLGARYNGSVFDIILIKTDAEGNYTE